MRLPESKEDLVETMTSGLELGGGDTDFGPRNVLYAVGLSVVLVSALWPFIEVLGFYFVKTGIEEMLLSARLDTPADVTRVLTRPLLSGAEREGIFYRPAATLSLSLDHTLWGYGAFGYQLVDLLMHAAVAGLLFHLAVRLSGGDVTIGLAVGLLYTINPLLVEVVPSVAHSRQHTLMVMWLLVGLLASFRHVHLDGRPRWLALALGAFVLAMASKETGVILLVLVLGHTLLYRDDSTPVPREWARRVRAWAPYLVVTLAYGAWWLYVTRARALVGGVQALRPPVLRRSVWKSLYLQGFVYPARVVPRYVESLLEPLRYSVVSTPWLPDVGTRGFDVGLPGILLLVGLLTVLFFIGLRVARGPTGNGHTNDRRVGRPGRTLAFSVVWLVVPVLFFSVTNTNPNPRRVYVGLLPLCLMVGTGTVMGARRAGRFLHWVYRDGMRGPGRRILGIGSLSLVGVLAGVFFAVGTFWVSPHLRDYPAWEHSQSLNRSYYRALFRELRKLPPGSDLRLVGVPRWVGQREPFPRVGTVALLLRPEPMLQWRFSPHRFGEIRWFYRDVFDPASSRLELNTRRLGSHDYAIVTRMGQGAG